MNIRSVQIGDIETITEIYREQVLHGTASFELTPVGFDEMKARVGALTSKGFPYLVLEIEGAVIGYAYAGPYRTRPAYRWAVENSIYVHEGARGKGYGKHLLNALIKECADKGFRQMIAVIGDSANKGSIGVHKSCGFEMVGTFKSVGWKHEQWLDTVLMQLKLGEGDTAPATQDSFVGKLL